MGIVVGIDASRNRSGGAKVHLVGILGRDPRPHGISKVHVWSYGALLDALPDAEWLVKHSPEELKGSLLRQVSWQRRQLPVAARAEGCDILLNTDAGTVCRFWPAVTMSRDMLSYEPGEMRRYGFSQMWLRLLALRYVQAKSLRSAQGALFLTEYASRVIQKMTGRLRRVAVIPHGVGAAFRQPVGDRDWPKPDARPIRCLYVSPLDLYKHQWNVVRAIGALRNRGHNVLLVLAGGGTGPARQRLDDELMRTDPDREFVTQVGFVPPAELPSLLLSADIFVFASSCENMPNTLVEGMASGLPIACANRGPMPEVLRDGGVYFDPENADSIASSIEELLVDPKRRDEMARRAAELSSAYSWERCAAETWAFIGQVHAESAVSSDAGEIRAPAAK
ncbi:MAG: glycosyltransferase family 1 protein [Gemmatimonadaceae bacterium]